MASRTDVDPFDQAPDNAGVITTRNLIWVLLAGLVGCAGDSTKPVEPDAAAPPEDVPQPEAPPGSEAAPALSCVEDTTVVVPTPAEHADWKAAGFDRYAELVAPNGKPIRFFAQAEVTDLQLMRARAILRFYLETVSDSKWGADKAAVANSMADRGATLMLPNGAHEEGNEPPFDAQPLYDAELPIEGSAWYQTNDWEHRDASFEEIFHLLHDTGIGTNQPGALPDYQTALDAEARAAIKDGRWGIAADPGVADWLVELEAEGSLAQEYIAAVIDSYYGYWGAWTEAPGGMWGIYIAKTRAEVGDKDPKGAALLQAFLPEMVTYEARLDPAFTGTFTMAFDPTLPYTHKSQYLLHATLTGDLPSGLSGNAGDNVLRGNSADNTLIGGPGDDTAVYCRPFGDYNVQTLTNGSLQVTGPDGVDTLTEIEHLHFADRIVPADML